MKEKKPLTLQQVIDDDGIGAYEQAWGLTDEEKKEDTGELGGDGRSVGVANGGSGDGLVAEIQQQIPYDGSLTSLSRQRALYWRKRGGEKL